MKIALLPFVDEQEVCVIECPKWTYGFPEFISALREAVREWIQTTKEGRDALSAHGNVLTIRDMSEYAPNCFVINNELAKIMHNKSIPRFSISTAYVDKEMDTGGVSGTTSLYRGKIR